MKNWGTIPLESLLLLCDNGTWGPLSSPDEGYPILRSTNISREWTLDLSGDVAYRKIEDAKAERYQLELGDIIVTKSSGSAHLIGQAALFDVQSKRPYLFSNFTQRLRPNHDLVLSEYLYFYLRSPQARQVIDKMHRTTSGLRNLKLDDYKSQLVPVPYPKHPERSLAEQRRIVARLEALLGEVRAMRDLAQEMEKDIERVMASALAEVFDSPNREWNTSRLAEVAFIQTGTAKGRRFRDRATVELPYLRVANVQAGYLDLTEVKTITIAESEIERYRLQPGDLLLTEGGDYDKLGRGAVWEGQIELCVHQNHIFAVRFDQNAVLPKFAEYEMQSWYARHYFLSVAKKTTNLATINKTKLGNFPLRYPSPAEQQCIVEHLDAIRDEVNASREQIAQDSQSVEQLEQSILAAAFRGEV